MNFLLLIGIAVVLAALISAGFWARSRLRRSLGSDVFMGEDFSLGQFVRPYRGPLGVTSALIIVQTIFDLAAPWPLKVAVDNIIGGQPLDGWMAGLNKFSTVELAAIVVLAGLALVAASGLLSYLAGYLIGAASERVGADIRSAAFGRLQHRSLPFHDRNRTGDLVSRLTSDVSRVKDILVSWFETLIPELLALLGMLAVLFAIDTQMALAALTVIPLLVIQIMMSRTRIKSSEREVRDRNGRLAAQATDVLRNVRAVQAFFRQDEEERRFRRESVAVTKSALTALDIQSRFAPTSDLILALGSGFILFLGIMRVTSGYMTLGTLLVVLTYLSSFYHPIRSLTRLSSVFARGAASRERLMEIFADDGLVPEEPYAIPAPRDSCALALRNVTFGYQRERPVLKNVTLEINAGETVCIVGPTGAGKSTLLSLLLRFYDPDEGAITMDGIDFKRFALRSLRDRLALVPQDTWILDGTVAENIRFGRPQATDDEIRLAGQMALVEEFVARLPEEYYTLVGEGGARLSGGQRRRVALARALVRDASIFLLDEPTSGLDARSETLVIEALRRVAQNRTLVMVSHRLRLAAIADRVVVLEGGQIVEQGPPTVLLAAGGAFARLWAQQSLPSLETKPRESMLGTSDVIVPPARAAM
jgi:ATP-binding cassette subfamily B protein